MLNQSIFHELMTTFPFPLMCWSWRSYFAYVCFYVRSFKLICPTLHFLRILCLFFTRFFLYFSRCPVSYFLLTFYLYSFYILLATLAWHLFETPRIYRIVESLVSTATFCRIFPFHVMFDRCMQIVQVGKSVSRIIPR